MVNSVHVPMYTTGIRHVHLSIHPRTELLTACVQPASPTAIQPRGGPGDGLGATADSMAGAQPAEPLHSMSVSLGSEECLQHVIAHREPGQNVHQHVNEPKYPQQHWSLLLLAMFD